MSYQNDTMLNLNVSPKLKEDFRTAANWAKIIAIVNFVNAGLSLITSIKGGSFLGAIIGAAISVLLNIYMLNFGKKVQSAIDATDQGEFSDGLNDLRMYFKVYGILIIVGVSLCILAILIFGAAFMNNIS